MTINSNGIAWMYNTIIFYSLSLILILKPISDRVALAHHRPTEHEIMGLIPELDEYSMMGVKKSVEEDTHTVLPCKNG